MITSERAIVYQWEKQCLSSGYIFALTEEGLARFEQYLQTNSEDPVYVVTDLPDEEFKYDKIPHVGAGDRKSLIERRLTRSFRSVKYSYYEIQGREQEGRRDDNVLFAGITEDEAIQPWIARLLEHKVPVAGIYSVALLTRHLLGAVGHEGGPGLIVSLERNAGLRQTFFLNKNFKFSRLVRMPRYGTEPYAPVIRDEVEKMLRYLHSMRYLTNETLSRVCLIGDKTLLNELKEECKDRPGIEFVFISLDHISERIGLIYDFVDPFAESVYAYLALKNRPRNIYAKEEETRYYQLRNIRNFMLGSSIFILLASLIWGGLSFMEAVTLKQQSISAVSKTEFYQTRYDMAKERLPELPVEPRDLKTAVSIADSLEAYQATPLPLFRTLSSALQQFPEIQISSMEWLSALDPDTTPQGDRTAQPDTRTSSSTAQDNDADYLYYQIANIKGYMAPFDGNYRRVISRINQLVEALRNEDDIYDVRIMTMPLDVSSEASLRGAADAVATQAEFSFRLVMGIADET
ncbi:MAG: hypothetical protein U5P41_00790 [Gammaproteobacteria bacterium]|nr:hypothetical protein [Gammaproteobacteria bacterium]